MRRPMGRSPEAAMLLVALFAFSFVAPGSSADAEAPVGATCSHPHTTHQDGTLDEDERAVELTGGLSSIGFSPYPLYGGGRRLLQALTICGGNGVYVTDISTSVTRCECSLGWAPPNCTDVVTCAAYGFCSGRGICIKGGLCACDPGWGGPNCTAGRCPKDCNGNGICDTKKAECMCNPGYSGRTCSVRGCASNCTDHGACVDGVCECDAGWSGANCGSFICVNECSGHGVCSAADMRCDCSPWFTGEDCSTPLCPSNCTGHGSCVGGACVCDSGWSGSDCSSHTCPNGCSGRGTCTTDGACICQTGYNGEACDLVTSCPVYDCSGHGTCRISPGQNATCDCDPGWGDFSCGDPTALTATLCLNNCSSHGSCINGTLCLCDGGWVGEDCSLEVGVSACPYDCFGRGSCLNGTCACDMGFVGPACNSTDDYVLCAGVFCSTGDIAMWSNGTCHCLMDEAGSRMPCPMNCSMRGSCFNGTCTCDTGFSGHGCEVASSGQLVGGAGGGCVNNCSEHGSCVNGTCLCDSGWASNDCSAVAFGAGGGGCPSNCTGHGACTENKTCFCDPGFFGPDCSVNAATAPPCAFNCSGAGLCVNSTCLCMPGYSGDFCQDWSAPGSTPMPGGANSSKVMCPGEGTCSRHGSCTGGVCACDPFWRGEACDVQQTVIVPDCPGECSTRGTCLNGTCMCDPMWDGVDCSYPSLCPGYTHPAGDNCTGHGVCTNGTCLCDTNWGGVDCSIQACKGGCSGHGICGNGTCACDMGWTGPNCDRPGCPGDCSGHGVCSEGLQFSAAPMCSCFPGWSGSGCFDPVCPTSMATMNPYVPCSGNGACFQDGKCLCYENYAGDDCSILIDCSGRGVRQCGFCVCQEGFEGDMCQVDICADSRVYNPEFPSDASMADVCSRRGKCTTLFGCECNQGFAGRNCSSPAVCTSQCAEKGGSCYGTRDTAGICTCPKYDIPNTPHDTPMFTGTSCNFPQCPGYRGIGAAGSPIVCSGKGLCDQTSKSCRCFTVQGEGIYTGIDCGVPPVYKITNIVPQVGPLEGGTIVTLGGPGLERIFEVLKPAKVFCDFGVSTRTMASIGPFADTIVCSTPPVSVATPQGTSVRLTDAAGAPFTLVQTVASFEFFAQTRIIRITPSYGPLRPVGGANELRGPAATNQPNMITVTGTYFPPNGNYRCRFGDCDAPEGTTVRVDAATVVCEMPTLAKAGRLTISVSSNGQQYSNTVGKPSSFAVFAIDSISPLCASSTGTAMLTVRGTLLVDATDITRDPGAMFCRFGRVTLSGQTRSAGLAYQPGFKLFAFHSLAMPSDRTPGALECQVPNWPIETSDFALSLSASYVETNTLLKDGYYLGQWDATPTITFGSFYQPSIIIKVGPGNQYLPHPYLIEPTLGPEGGGTRVTIAGLGFDFARYGPLSGNDVFAAWSPPKPYCNKAPIPSCKFGTAVSRDVEILNNETVVCISPILPESIDTSTTVVVSVALDGQTYSTASPAIFFQFAPQHRVTGVFPASGVRTGGTKLTVTGVGFVDANTGDDDANTVGVEVRLAPRVLTCVFISVDSPTIRFKSSSTRFISPSQIECVAPFISSPGEFILDVSLSGQTFNNQLSQSAVKYIFYQDPALRDIRDDIGSINGGETVAVIGENFISLSTLGCRFGTIVVPGALINGNIQCVAPAVNTPMTVNVEITMNGFDFSATNPPLKYTFYNIVKLEPSSGPAHGGTFISVRISGGAGMYYTKPNGEPRFSFQAVLGGLDATRLAGTYNAATDMIVFAPPTDAVSGQYLNISHAATPPLDFKLALTSSQTFVAFPGRKFIIYDSSFRTVLPCMVRYCEDLVLPKNDVSYPVTFGGDRLVNLDTILCGYIPMSAASFAAGPGSTFRKYINGVTPGTAVGASFPTGGYTFPGVYNATEDLVYCSSPKVPEASSLDGYHVVIALNGQNFVGLNQQDEVFNLVYLPVPAVTSLGFSGGLVTGGAQLLVKATSWNYPTWYKPAQAPPTLSCNFFLPAKGVFRFAEAKNPSCVGSVCTATCETPDFSGYADVDGVLVRSQVFISLNRRDPCLRCGCVDSFVTGTLNGPLLGTSGFAAKTCSNAPGNDYTTKLTRFDEETQGFCSRAYMVLADAHFCRGNRGSCPMRNAAAETGVVPGMNLDDVEFNCLGAVYQGFTFYKAPLVKELTPAFVGGPSIRNTSATTGPIVVLNGDFFAASQWATWPSATWPTDGTVQVRLVYMDALNYTILLNGSFVRVQGTKLTVRIPIPCADQLKTGKDVLALAPKLTDADLAACFAATGVFIQQTRPRMEVSIEVSFNGGVQFTRVPINFVVYKDFMCPTDGCGHGSCIYYDQSLQATINPAYPLLTFFGGGKAEQVPVCYCGLWEPTPPCFFPAFPAEVPQGQYMDRDLQESYRKGGTKSCKENILWYDLSGEIDGQSPLAGPVSPSAPQGMYTLWDKFGRPAIWPHGIFANRQVNEQTCKSGPVVTFVEPTIGSLSGGTSVVLTMSLTPGMSWDSYTSNQRPTEGTSFKRALETFFVCVFNQGSISQVVVPATRVALVAQTNQAKYSCTAPAISAVSGSDGVGMTLAATFVNPKNVLSPKMFDGVATYTYSALPVVTSVYMEVNGDLVPTRNGSISIPLCQGDCIDRNKLLWAIVLEGSGFVQTSQLVCRVNGVLTRATYKSPTQVNCTLTTIGSNATINTPGMYRLEVSLNNQANEWVYAGQLDLFAQPSVVKDVNNSLSFGVDPAKVSTSLSAVLGTTPCVDSQCNQKMNEYAQLGPVTGGTPLVFYVSEAAASTRVPQWSTAKNMTLLFGQCSSACPPGTPDNKRFGDACTLTPVCTCSGSHRSPAMLAGPQNGGGVNRQLYKLTSSTPGSIVDPGRYMVCLSMNGVHFLPMYNGIDTFHFRFYLKPIVTKLSTLDGPIHIPFATYNLDIFGDNFPVKTPYSLCDSVDIGLCREFSPRIFVQIGTYGTTVGGYGSLGQLSPIAYGSPLVNVTDGKISMVMPDLRLVSINDFTGNITVSFNGYDFTPVVKGVTEFGFYRIPTVSKTLSPKWGHYDSETDVVISGQGFQPTPGRSMCRIASCTGDCSSEGSTKMLVPATYVSPTQVKCRMLARPPFVPQTLGEVDRSRQMFVSFTPDGRLSTAQRNPAMYDNIMFAVGSFSLSAEVKFMNVSSTAAPTSGGTSLKLVIINHRFAQQCMDMTLIDTLMVGLVPTSGLWKIARPEEYGDYIATTITSRKYQKVNNLIGNFEANVCLMYITVRLPVVPYPLEADIKISLNNGQQFMGPATPMLFYRPAEPISNIPTRGSRDAASRPQLTVYFDSSLFDGANPEYTVIQTVVAFAPTPDCSAVAIDGAEGVCALGPTCRFSFGTTLVEAKADFTFDTFLPYVVCTVPQFPVQAVAQVSISLDGVSFFGGPKTQFLFFDAPKVNYVLPTNGYWSARTNILVEGAGFLDSTAGSTHLTWCIFDFEDILPKSQVWEVPRRWTKAFIYPNSNNTLITCTSPVIQDSERPTTINPRARVGVIIDGICQEQDAAGNCIALKNSDAKIVSDAFFVYTSIPKITAASPVAAIASGGLAVVTVFGTGFMDSYTWGPPALWSTATLPVGFESRQMKKLCVTNGYSSPASCPGLSCRFGQSCPANGIGNCSDVIIDATLDALGRVLCVPPKVDPLSKNAAQLRTVALSVSLNGQSNEFSNELSFTFTNQKVFGPVTPSRGIASGGGIVSISGDQFVNTTCLPGSTKDCLACNFTSSASLQYKSHLVAATFISSSLISCVVPSTAVFGMAPADIPEVAVCGSDCVVSLSATTNGIDFVPSSPSPTIIYRYEKPVYFTSFRPNAGPITGRTNVTILGNGFAPSLDVWCRIGINIVKATFRSITQMVCMVPAVQQAVQGGVFIGFSTNSIDFCELRGTGQIPDCKFSTQTTPSERPYFYHDPLVATSISPPSGIQDGGTEVIISGSGFTNYGQIFYAQFKLEQVQCTAINVSAVRCYAPALPFLQDNQGVSQYILDVAVPVLITCNQQQFTEEQSGQNCQLNPDILNDDNARATCKDPFVMWTWFKLPIVTSVFRADGRDVPNFNKFLNPDLYSTLKDDLGELTIPQGPASGGTTVVLKGQDFMSFARVELTNGPGVICPGGVKPAPPGQSCTTTCTFPFRHSITGAAVLYYSCINLRRIADQGGYNPDEYWCAIHGTAPATFSGEYGTCRYQISTFRDYLQGGKVVTHLECLFGNTHVPAKILDNSTITCDAPRSDYGIVVPLSVTLNRRDYSLITPRTRFQYIAAAPMATLALPDDQFATIAIGFNTATNKAGLLDLDGVLKSDNSGVSGCTTLLDPAFVATLGVTAPTCQWLPGNSVLRITPTVLPSYKIGDVVRFKSRPCELTADPSKACWSNRVANDLLSAPLAQPGCAYPKSTACNPSLPQSYQSQWCGRCIPDALASVNVVSYPFNQSALDLKISAPGVVTRPMPQISAPSFVDSCTKLCRGGTMHGARCNDAGGCPLGTCVPGLVTLIGSTTQGLLGRPLSQVRWSLVESMSSNDPSIVANLNAQLASISRSGITTTDGMNAALKAVVTWEGMPAVGDLGTVNKGQYCFSLLLTNWLGGSRNTTSCKMVTRSKDVAVPEINIDGGMTMTRSYNMTDDIQIKSIVTASACASNSSIMTFGWAINPLPQGWSTGLFNKAANTLIVPAFSLKFQFGVPYSFMLNATLKDPGQKDIIIQVAIPVTFTESAPVAAISGGNSRTIAKDRSLTLDGSASYDVDKAPADRTVSADLLFCWSCVTAQGSPCNLADDVAFTAATGATAYVPVLVVPPGPLLSQSTSYTVTLTVAKKMSLRTCGQVLSGQVSLTGRATQTITVSPSILLPVVMISAPEKTVVSGDQTVRLSAYIESSACPATGKTSDLCDLSSYSWNVHGQENSATSRSALIGKGARGFEGTGYGSITLVVPPNSLTGGQPCGCYTFTLTAVGMDKVTSNTASITLRYNDPPKSGTFSVLSDAGTTVGTALTSPFTFDCQQWADDPDQTPLTYQFFYTATTYTEDALHSVLDATKIALGGRQFGSTLTTSLPQGDKTKNNDMTVFAHIYDTLGAVAVESRVIRVDPDTSQADSMRGTSLLAVYQAKISKLINDGDPALVYRYLTIVGNVLADPDLKQDRYINSISAIRTDCLAKIQLLSVKKSRRAVSATTYLTLTSPAEVVGIASSFFTVLGSVNVLTLDQAQAVSVVDQLASQIAPLTIKLGSSPSEEQSTAKVLLWILGICQNAIFKSTISTQSVWDKVAFAIKGILVNYMRGKSGELFQTDRNDLAVIATRLSSTVSDTETELKIPASAQQDLLAQSQLVTFTNRILTGQSGLTSHGVDVHVVAYNGNTNPFASSSTQTVRSRVVSMNVYKGLASTDITTVPTAAAPLVISNLADSDRVTLKLIAIADPPAKNKNITTGVFTATVCAFWNSTNAKWLQFHTSYLADAETKVISCLTNHLTDFATTDGTVGCDQRASSAPATNNLCEVCGGGAAKPMQGICDWKGVPCRTGKDRCGVCGGTNKSFVNTDLRNETGVCDYRGVACQVVDNLQQIPTVCGVCAYDYEKDETKRNAGICDCQGTGVPNGGKILDRCNICNGGNKSMDYCGINGDIPNDQVCHTGGIDDTWNSSCTGCDGVPRPDLPSVPNVKNGKYEGGVLVDVCNICGGNGANCTGCDGVMGSNAKKDVCGVCKGTGLSCKGCDGLSSIPPKQLDTCSVCGGPNYGSCDKRPSLKVPVPCDYNTLTPKYICQQGCDGISGSGAKFDRCGECQGGDKKCKVIPECLADSTSCPNKNKGCDCKACAEKWIEKTGCNCGVYQDACGKCGGDGKSCLGCDGFPMSGKVFDLCGICDGDNSQCLGCDGVVNSGKKFDLCGECDGGNKNRDICGVCGGDGSSCTGADGLIYSGVAVDACRIVGGTNRCKWRDGDPPAASKGSTDAVSETLLLATGQRRKGVLLDDADDEAYAAIVGSSVGLAMGLVLALWVWLKDWQQ